MNRYQSNELQLLVVRLEAAEEDLKEAISPFFKRLFKKFYKRRNLWNNFLKWISEIDCLMSFAEISADIPNMVKPKIIEDEKQIVHIKQLRHPWVEQILKNFVPNDVCLGGEEPLIHLITGPNMGGKSTLLRQTAIAIIMTQIGCFVPAEECKITLIDRIFTRIGANDRILENKSTFFLEMEETKAIVEQATPDSLIIMDELGRGTSTFDGYSIAHAVLSYQINKKEWATLFTTHYHMLVDAFKSNPKVQPMKMLCEVDQETGHVEFKYKFTKGYTDKSEGIFVAKMAWIPHEIVKVAQIHSDLFRKKLKDLEIKFRSTDVEME